MINWETININNDSTLTLANNLTLGGASADLTATLNVNATLFARNENTVIQANRGLALLNNAGLINLSSSQANHALTIRGNYVGAGGTLEINSVVNGDDSPADKLVIDGKNIGSSAVGNTRVIVNNFGGTGAFTSKGILVIEAINKATTANGAISLVAPLRVGIFDYRLLKGGSIPADATTQQNWYLSSTFTPNPSPTPPSPTPSTGAAASQNLLPIVGPELSVFGSVLPTAMSLDRVTLGTLKDRVGDEICLLTNPEQSETRFGNSGKLLSWRF
ncbi:hypothetical protein BH10PSE19_BH10PSE19_05450 [soil metagenome]